jgi:hypothetical protein
LSTTYAAGEPPRVVSAAAKLYAKCLLVAFALLPAYLIGYLWFFSDPRVVFENHVFHEFAIAAATLEGASSPTSRGSATGRPASRRCAGSRSAFSASR